MFPAERSESDEGEGVGDAVEGSREVTGIVPSDFGGVEVHPMVMRNNISTRGIQTVFKANFDLDILTPCFTSELFLSCLIIFITLLPIRGQYVGGGK